MESLSYQRSSAPSLAIRIEEYIFLYKYELKNVSVALINFPRESETRIIECTYRMPSKKKER